MFQHDYILRMIEMMGDLMRRVKELMDELSQMRLMDEACRRHCGLPMGALEALSAESLVELLAPTPRLFASELLYTRAEAFRCRLSRSAMPGLKACGCSFPCGRKGRCASCEPGACRR